jgi:hypothetical protein
VGQVRSDKATSLASNRKRGYIPLRMTWTDQSFPACKCIIRPIPLDVEYFVGLRRLILLWERHSLKVQTSIAEVALLEIDIDAAHFEWLAIAGVSIEDLGCAVR